jgi:DNA helicase-2/ATP-dependent DNA helicase PcrA
MQTPSRTDSPLQIAVFDEIKHGTGNICVLATAGSGKTTTILKGLNFIPRHHKSIFLSFSASIVKELKDKVPAHIQAATLHATGMGMMRRYYGKNFHVTDPNKEMEKYMKLAIQLIKQGKGDSSARLDKKEYRSAALMNDVCKYARMTLTPFTKEDLSSMCAYYNIDFDEQIILGSLELLKNALKLGNGKVLVIDYVDMIYFPAVIPAMVDLQFNTIFLDEAQDTNKAQFAMLERMLKKDGRLIAVGDDFQCIYGFSGADVDAFRRIRERPNTITLPLSISYRCSKAVVRKAQEINPEIQAYEHAREGAERMGTWDEITENDLVLSRTTKPLIGLYFLLLEKGVRARIIGKEIEAGLADLAEICMSDSIEGVLYNFETQFETLTRSLNEVGVQKVTEHAQYRALEEKVQVLTLILGKIDSPKKLIATIHDIFDEKKQAAKLMTIHRSKGLENERVFVIVKVAGVDLMPSKWAKQKWEHIQETNLQFVAFTRAKDEVVYINLEDVPIKSEV